MRNLVALAAVFGHISCVPMSEIRDSTIAQEQVGAEVTRFGDVAFREIAPGVWQHTTYLDLPGIGPVPSNGLLVVDGTKTVLVDTAWTDSQTAQIVAWADGVLAKPIRAAIVTHAHKDKMGGIAALHEAGIDTWAHPLTNELAPANGFEQAKQEFTFDKDGWALGGADAFLGMAIYYPGGAHTRDNIVVGVPSQRLLFGGCMIKGTDSATLGNLADADIGEYESSALRVERAFPDALFVAMSHSQPEGREALQHTIDLAEEL